MKKYVIIPVALFIYLAFMAYLTWPAKNPAGRLSYTQYYVTIGVTTVIIFILAYFLKKKEENRQKKDKKR
jgi:phosphotransferase system  glucose/maltose/N-acetylglucosamine-specific IIC component